MIMMSLCWDTIIYSNVFKIFIWVSYCFQKFEHFNIGAINPSLPWSTYYAETGSDLRSSERRGGPTKRNVHN